MADLRLLRLSLTNFRSYEALVWRPGASLSVIHGPNGSGKTNLLEAVSLLTPGRGLRSARNPEFARHGASAWAVAAQIQTAEGVLAVGTGTSPNGPAERRVFRVDHATLRSQAELASQLACVWLTPQMGRLFLEGASARRRFLDRLAFALEPSHAREVGAHDTAVAQRNRLLAEGRPDPAWASGIEDAIARHAVAVTASRLALVQRLNATLLDGAAAPFPIATLVLHCPIADRLQEEPALAVEDWLRASLAGSRAADMRAGGASLGAHRAELGMVDAATGVTAALASTGQQKSFLIGIVLGHAALIAAERGFGPLLLLDEPLVHLDRERRAALLAALPKLGSQALLTGVDAEPFAALRGIAEGLATGGGGLRPDAGFSASSPGR